MIELQEGTVFAKRYRLIKEQGRGSFGEVWLAQDEQLDNMQVAIKIYIALDDRGIEDFKKEYKTAYDLNHPNLLHANHFDIFDRRPFLVMPYCPDSALSFIGKCERETLWRFVKDVSSGLSYLHSQDVVHHDIKPDNILRMEDGRFVITDFGISTNMRSTLRRNSTRGMNHNASGGSLPYMGPEMFAAKPESIKATDIWAFGVTLYEMITGDLPFFGQGGVMQLNGAEVPELEYEDPEIVKLVKSCLSKEPWDRPTADRIKDSSFKKRFEQDGNKEDTYATMPYVIEQGSSASEQVIASTSNPRLTSISLAAIILCILISAFCIFPGIYSIGVLGPVGGLISIAGCVLLLKKERLGYYLCCVGGGVAAIQFSLRWFGDYIEYPDIWGFLVIMVYGLFPILGMSVLQIESRTNGLCSWEIMSISNDTQSTNKKRIILSHGDNIGLKHVLDGRFLKVSGIVLLICQLIDLTIYFLSDNAMGDFRTDVLLWSFVRMCDITVLSIFFIKLLKASRTTLSFTLGMTGVLLLCFWTIYRTLDSQFVSSLIEFDWMLYCVPLVLISLAFLFLTKYLCPKSLAKELVFISSFFFFAAACSVLCTIWYGRIFQMLAYISLSMFFFSLVKETKKEATL